MRSNCGLFSCLSKLWWWYFSKISLVHDQKVFHQSYWTSRTFFIDLRRRKLVTACKEWSVNVDGADPKVIPSRLKNPSCRMNCSAAATNRGDFTFPCPNVPYPMTSLFPCFPHRKNNLYEQSRGFFGSCSWCPFHQHMCRQVEFCNLPWLYEQRRKSIAIP